MRILVTLIALSGLFAHGITMAQHTPLTSQYLFNGLVINPAYAGSRDALAANLSYRQQWVGLDGAPVSQTLSIHAPVARRKVGLGLMVLNDRIGVSEQSGVFTSYAYRMRMPNKAKLALGLGLGATLFRARWTEVAIQQAGDEVFAVDTKHAIRPNFSAGAFYYNKKWFAGISLPFLLVHSYNLNDATSVLSEVKLDAQPMMTGGALFDISDALKWKPSTLVRYRTESGLQADLSSNFILRDKVWLGTSYRTGDALIGSVEFLPNPQWRLGYSYDMGLSAIRSYHNGSHELMVQYEFGYRIKVKDPRYF